MERLKNELQWYRSRQQVALGALDYAAILPSRAGITANSYGCQIPELYCSQESSTVVNPRWRDGPPQTDPTSIATVDPKSVISTLAPAQTSPSHLSSSAPCHPCMDTDHLSLSSDKSRCSQNKRSLRYILQRRHSKERKGRKLMAEHTKEPRRELSRKSSIPFFGRSLRQKVKWQS
jgi:hypothetical protein